MEAFFYPSRIYNYGLEPPVISHGVMTDMDPWYGRRMQPIVHSPFGYRPVHYPVATRRGCNDGRFWGDVFTPRRSRATSIRFPFQQLFGDEFFRSALTDDITGLLEHHSQKLGEANHKSKKTSENGSKTQDTTSSVASTSESATPNGGKTIETLGSTKPSTSSAEPSKDSSSSVDNTRKEVAEKREKDPSDGYILHLERSPHGFYRPVYSPVTLSRERDAALFKQRLDHVDNDFFKYLTDDLLSLLEHHVSGLDNANRMACRSEQKSTENATSDIARKEDVDKTGKPFNVSLKLGDFQPENVNVSLDGRKVIVKAKRDEHGDDEKWRRHSEVEYSFIIPEDTPSESLTSSFNTDGILSITARDDASNKPLEGSSEKECEGQEADGTMKQGEISTDDNKE